ncbi:MAG: hypothetical protein C0394_10435 [Syntrophus sp. (in: bacteria)]|nr:hypothetical protein [Syntrophus sp. (in: bacteria)]
MYFNIAQMSLAENAFRHAETLTGRYFRIGPEAMKGHRYDIKTLAYLDRHEVNSNAFAHLCKYHCHPGDKAGLDDGLHFYRICLQDNRILDAVDRAGSFIKLSPLLLYIAAHELVHVIRFDSGYIDFDAPLADKQREEEKVHEITRDVLRNLAAPELNLVVECFSSRYQIGDLYQ